MNLDGKWKATLAAAALATYRLEGLPFESETALRALEVEATEQLEGLSDPELARVRHDKSAIPGTTAEDFEEKLIEISPGKGVVCGIRHLGMNLELPFVELWPSWKLSSVEEARELYRQELSRYFSMFHPRWIKIFTPDGNESESGGALCVVSRHDWIKERGEWPVEGRLERFEVPENADYFAWYESCYRKLLEETPVLRNWVTQNDLELMELTREMGLLKVAYVEGRLVGLIAAEEEKLLGHDALYFVEVLVESDWRGKGLGRAIQRRFVDEYQGEAKLVWGMIDRKNECSLRIAKANGRTIIRGECFLEV